MFVSLCVLALCLSAGLSAPDRLFHLEVVSADEVKVVEVVTENPGKRFRISEDGVRAKALYRSSINETGWSFLEIGSNENISDVIQAYSAGFVEGAVTYDLIYMHWFNTLGDFCTDRQKLCDDIDFYVKTNTKWVEQQIEEKADSDSYWHQVNLFYKQLQGLSDGYTYGNKDPSRRLAYKDLLWLNLQGDFEDLVEVFQAKQRNFQTSPNEEPTGWRMFGNGHCSALIKVLPDGSNLFTAQETWSSYQSMLRIQKKYDLRFHLTPSSKDLIPGFVMTFSSYPGVTSSGDDFYLISSGLATLETTIGNSNASLWQYVQPVGQVSEGIRSMVANRLATTGLTWTNLFKQFNSGTYNNQWMIVDYKLFKYGTVPANLPDGLLFVIEQIPGYTQSGDMTDVLRSQGYWPSYNVAAFPDVFNLSGNLPLVKKYGDWFTYKQNPRAKIFRRDHGNVRDLKSMLALMRYNDFKHDPLSRCDCNPPYSAENAIAARCDLNPASGTYPFSALGHRSHGATDAKVTSHFLFLGGLRFLSVSGPVYNTSLGLEPFQWSKADFEKTTPHLGHPDMWTFQPLVHVWSS